MAFTAFQPNCSLPQQTVAYVGAPPLRSTLDIVWSSVSTLIACTYGLLHLVIIADTRVTTRPSLFWRDKLQSLRNLTVELVVAAVALFAPEYIFCGAAMDLYNSSYYAKELNKRPDSTRKWTLTHGHYIRMGGFRYCFKDSRDDEETRKDLMLDYGTILLAIEIGAMSCDPPFAEIEILDHSSVTKFAKALAMVQIAWFGLNVIVRLARGLSLSQLEIGVSAFAVVSVFIWALNFSKPKGVQFGTTIQFDRTDELLRLETSVNKIGIDVSEYGLTISDLLRVGFLDSVPQASGPGENTTLLERLDRLRAQQSRREQSIFSEIHDQVNLWSRDWAYNGVETGSLLLSAFAAIPFGAIHVAGWNADFPTIVDLWTWRAGALATMSPIVVFMLLAALLHCIPEPIRYCLSTCLGHAPEFDILNIDDFSLGIAKVTALILYSLGRFALVAEMIRCMLYLPPEAFIATWTQNLPHFG